MAQAAELAETPSERERVVRAEAEYQEECRQTWLRYHTATGEYETALDLVVTEEEVRALSEHAFLAYPPAVSCVFVLICSSVNQF